MTKIVSFGRAECYSYHWFLNHLDLPSILPSIPLSAECLAGRQKRVPTFKVFRYDPTTLRTVSEHSTTRSPTLDVCISWILSSFTYIYSFNIFYRWQKVHHTVVTTSKQKRYLHTNVLFVKKS